MEEKVPDETAKKSTTIHFFGLDVKSKKTPLILVKFVIALWLFSWIFILLVVDEDKRGMFGDMFGAINSLFSGLAFAGIIYSILIQSEELKAQSQQLEAQREELELTREEMKLTRQEHELARQEFSKQNVNMKRGRFESMFFNMVTFHFKIVEDVNPPVLFERILISYRGRLGQRIAYDDSHDFFSRIWEETIIAANGQVKINRYLQSLISIQQIITSARLTKKAQAKYFFIANSYLSYTEKRFLFYYITIGYRAKGIYAALIDFEEYFGILEQLAPEELLHHSHQELKMYKNWQIQLE